MEIPNYNSHDYKNKKFKQLHPFMPHDTFRMLICGNSGGGKTNLLYHMLIEPLLYFDEIYLCAKNLDQEKYQKLINKMNEMSKKVGYDIMNISNDKIIPVGDMDYEYNQKLIICDDYVCEKNQRQLIDYFIQGRHKNCSVIYLSQSFYKTPRRHKIKLFSLLSISSRERNMISEELGVNKEKFKGKICMLTNQ